MTDLFLITGFFGSGKTTLIKNLIAQSVAHGRTAGVILNEFGGISFDRVLIGPAEGVRFMEISGGSVFADSAASPFLEALESFAKDPADVLLVETSGFSNPAEMVRLIAMVNEKYAGIYNYASAVCVVDCASFIRLIQSVPLVRNQIMASSLVLVNKTDIVDARTLREVNMIITKLHEKARVVSAVMAELPIEILYETPALTVRESSSLLHPVTAAGRPDAFLLEGDGELEKVLTFFREAGKTVYRAKGYWNEMGNPYYIESINGEVTKQPAGDIIIVNCIVIIARHGRDIHFNFEEHLSDCGITIN